MNTFNELCSLKIFFSRLFKFQDIITQSRYFLILNFNEPFSDHFQTGYYPYFSLSDFELALQNTQ